MKIIYKCTLEMIDEFNESEYEACELKEISEEIIEELKKGLSKNGTVNITGDSVEVIK